MMYLPHDFTIYNELSLPSDKPHVKHYQFDYRNDKFKRANLFYWYWRVMDSWLFETTELKRKNERRDWTRASQYFVKGIV